MHIQYLVLKMKVKHMFEKKNILNNHFTFIMLEVSKISTVPFKTVWGTSRKSWEFF